MVPAALLILVCVAVLVIAGLGWYHRQSDVNAKQDKVITKLREDHERLKEFFNDVIVGHADEVRLKRALERIFSKES